MKGKTFIPLILFFFCALSLKAQERFNIGDREFVKENGIWYQIESGVKFQLNHRVITVKFKEGVPESKVQNFNRQNGVRVLRRNKIGFVDLEIPSKADPIKMVQLYLSSGLVEVAEPNTFGIFLRFPNDSLFVYQWNLNQQNDADIDAPEAWDIETGRSSVVVGILDSGTDWGHEDLDENIWRNPGEDSWSNPNDPNSGNGVDDDGNGICR